MGFTPYLDGEQTDMSVVAGLKGEIVEDTHYDFSVGMGSNKLDYTLYNSLNPDASLVEGVAQRDFNTGDFGQRELNFNVDLTTKLSRRIHLAYGLEHRTETFTQVAGEENSYVGAGASGLIGNRPEDAGEYSRSNYALYTDVEHHVTDFLDLQYALRFENFNDFGSTINAKGAGRYDVTGDLALRGAISTGFHAPTPGQSNLRATTTSFTNGVQYDVGHFPAGHESVQHLGSTKLMEEKSVNISLGVVYEMEDLFVFTADYYNINIGGRIYRADLDANGNDGLNDTSFYTNAMDLRHSGVDFVFSGNLMDWLDVDMDIRFAYNINQVRVTKSRLINGVQVVNQDLIEDIENNYPSHNFTLTTYTQFTDDLGLMVRGRYIGSHYDQEGTIHGSVGKRSKKIDPTVYLDLEVNYKAIDGFVFALGGSNILDTYPTKVTDDGVHANKWGAGQPYPRRSAANYEGGAWYMKASYLF